MVISASSHCTLADVLPSFTTPSRVASLPVCLCTHRPPILNPPSTPLSQLTPATPGGTAFAGAPPTAQPPCGVRFFLSPPLALPPSHPAPSLLCAERSCAVWWPLLEELLLAGSPWSAGGAGGCWRLIVWVQCSERCKIRTSWVVASARTVATGLQIGSPGNRSRGVPSSACHRFLPCREGGWYTG